MTIQRIQEEVALNYGGVSEKEQEVVVRLDRYDRQATISSTWAEWSRRLERLYGPPGRTNKGQDGRTVCAFWTVPLPVVILRRAKAKRRLTDEERQRLADRLRTARSIRQSHREVES